MVAPSSILESSTDAPDDRQLKNLKFQTPLATTKNGFPDTLLADRLESKKSTIVTWKNAQRNMLEFFGPEKLIRDITIADGESFERWLRKHEKLAEATARKRMQICKQFLSSAIKARIIRENPFDGCKVANRPNPKRQHFVTTEDAQKIMDACSDAEWRCLVALSRYGALRVPSEPRQLRWDDVNWSENVLYVRATKTEHHEDDGDRVVPLFPELRAALNEQWEMAAEGEIYVLPNLRHTTNPLTTLNRIIKRSGVEPFPKAWANMRATRATELQSHFGDLLATKWCGHSQRIAKDYYWMQTADDVAKAANWSTDIAVGANRVQQPPEDARNTEK